MEDGGRRMEDSRQNLRTEFRAATESSGLAGFGLASVGMLCVQRPESRPARWRRIRTSGREKARTDLRAGRHGFGTSTSKTSLRILARTFGSQPRAAHLSKST